MSEREGYTSQNNSEGKVKPGDLVTIFRPERFAGFDVEPQPLDECHETMRAIANTAFGDAAIGKGVRSNAFFTDDDGIETHAKIVAIKSSSL